MDDVFQQNQQEKQSPGGPFLIQLLFRQPVALPDRNTMTGVMERHCGRVDCFCHDEKTVGFAARDHIAAFKDGDVPVQLMVMACTDFLGTGFDAFLKSQMWDCREDRDRLLAECAYQVVAVDMLAAGLPAGE